MFPAGALLREFECVRAPAQSNSKTASTNEIALVFFMLHLPREGVRPYITDPDERQLRTDSDLKLCQLCQQFPICKPLKSQYLTHPTCGLRVDWFCVCVSSWSAFADESTGTKPRNHIYHTNHESRTRNHEKTQKGQVMSQVYYYAPLPITTNHLRFTNYG